MNTTNLSKQLRENADELDNQVYDNGLRVSRSDVSKARDNERLAADELESQGKKLAEMRAKSLDLIEIVEGVRNQDWHCNGHRLKDTPEWCAFYVSVRRTIKEAK